MIECGVCAYWVAFGPTTGKCHRHSPRPGTQVDDTSYWLETLNDDGCAEGVPREEGKEVMIRCRDCAFWRRRKGDQGLFPKRRGDLPLSWWREAGFCARFAPDPGSTTEIVVWRATHANDRCGDGEPKQKTE
jgi:hypothetical protein